MRLIAFTILVLGSAMSFADTLPPPLPGGYIQANATDSQVQAAADFAAQQINQGTVVQIISSQSQVVAGMNYKMRLVIANPQGQQETYDVVVFVPLPVQQAPMQLTSADLLVPAQNTMQNPPQ